MKKLLLYLLILITPIFLFSEDINSIEKLKVFMEDGQKNGYFPKTLLLTTYGTQSKLAVVDLDFRTTIHWNMNAKCPNNADEIILALGKENHSIVCDRGDTAGLLGSGDDWIKDATGNDMYYMGAGNDTADGGSGSDIFIFEEGWGKDRITLTSKEVDTTRILGYDGSYPWKYSGFIIFGKSIDRADIVWLGNTLFNVKTGDSIVLNTQKVNILFASEKVQKDQPIPVQEKMNLLEFKAESVFKKEDILYLAKGNEGLHIVDSKDPDNARVLSKLVLPGRALSLFVENGIAYVGQGDYHLEGKRGWMSIIDVRNKNAPKLLKTLKYGSNIRTFALAEGRLYVPASNQPDNDKRELYIYNVTNPLAVQLLSTTKLHTYVSNMVYFNKKLYFSGSANYLYTVDIGDVQHPKVAKKRDLLLERVYGIHVKDDLLILAGKDHLVYLYLVQTDQTLKHVCTLKTIDEVESYAFSYQNSMDIFDDIIYKAEGKNGISISSLSRCKMLNTLSINSMPTLTRLIKIQDRLLTFDHYNKKSRMFVLGNDAVEVKKQPLQQNSRTRNRAFSVPKMSQDQLQTALYKASTSNDAKEVERLCKLGAKANEYGHEKHSPVEIASRLGRLAALKALLANGGNATKKSMMLAALREQLEAMKILEDHGIPLTVSNKDKCTTLHYIAQDGSVDMVKYLIEKDVPYNAVCRKDESPLTWANYGNNCKVIDYLETLYPPSHKKSKNKHCREQKIKKQQALEAKIKQREARKKYEALQEKNIRKGIYSPEEQALMKLKMKVKQKGNDLNMKFLVVHPMITKEMATRRKISIRFLEHVTIFMGERLLFDATLSPNLSQNPMFKVKVKNSVIDEAFTLTAVNNIGYQKSLTLQPKEVYRLPTETSIPSKENQVRDFRQVSPEIWSAKSVDDATKVLYGDVLYHEGNIKITLPDIASNTGAIPITIKSDIDLESVAILSNTTEHPVIVVFNVPKGLKVDYHLKFKAKNYDDEYVLVIAKGRDGKYYKAIKKFEIAYGGDNCS